LALSLFLNKKKSEKQVSIEQYIEKMGKLVFVQPQQLAEIKKASPDLSLFLERVKKPLLLAAFPKSGSSFTRRVMVQLTKAQTVRLSYYYGTSEQELYFPYCIANLGQNRFTQMHLRASDAALMILNFLNIKPVVLVRNIFDVIVSYADFYESLYQRYNESPDTLMKTNDGWFKLPTGHDLYVDEPFFELSRSQRIDLIIENMLPWYFNFYLSWKKAIATKSIDALWLNYQDMLDDDNAFIQRISTHQGLSFTKDQIVQAIAAVKANERGSRLNVGVSGRGLSSLSSEQIQRIRHLASLYSWADFSDIGL